MSTIGQAYRDAWHLAWPLILSNVTVPLLGMADTAVVGHLPEPHHLGAVALGATTFNAVYFSVVALRMGTTGLIAQAYGADERLELQAGLARALGLALGLAVVMILLTGPIIDAAAWIYQPSEPVQKGLGIYLQIRLLASPAALANMVIIGWLVGVQDTRGPLYLLITGNSLNILLDVVLVMGFGWEVAGVAWATVIAEYVTLVLGAVFVVRRLGGRHPALRWSTLLDLPAIRRLASVNGDIVIRSLTLQVAFIGISALGSRQGETVLAANAVLMQFNYFAAFALDGFAFAASTLVGRHVGRRDRAAMAAAVRAGLFWSFVFALFFTLIYVVGGRTMIGLLTDIDEVADTAAMYLPYAVIAPLTGTAAFLFDGVYVGATRTAEMRNGMLASLAVFGLCAWLLMPPLGNHGLWLTFHAFMIVRGAWLAIVYQRLENGGGFMPASSRTAAHRT